jgi:hypothetical protein
MSLKEKLLEKDFVVDNQYLDKYCELVLSGRGRNYETYKTQFHHIIPRYVLENNSDENLTVLSNGEHALAHYYLALCSSNAEYKYNNILAVQFITKRNFNDIDERWIIQQMSMLDELYEYAKKYQSVNNAMFDEDIKIKHRQKMQSEETRRKISNTMKKKFQNGELFSKEHRENISKGQKGQVYINKDGIYTRVNKEDLDSYLNDGWTLGARPLSKENRERLLKLRTGYKFSDESRKKMSESHKGQIPANKGVPLTKEQRDKISRYLKGTRWMTNEIVQKQVRPEEVENYLNNGFRFGKLPRKRGGDNL